MKRYHKKKKTKIDPNTSFKRRLYSKYRMSVEEYNELFIKQNGCCGCCGKHQIDLDRRLAVDHNHETGEIRGLLCFSCNTGLGKLGDNLEGVLKMLEYLNDK